MTEVALTTDPETQAPTERFPNNPRILPGTPYAAWGFPVSRNLEHYTVALGYGNVSAIFAPARGAVGMELAPGEERGNVLLVHGYTGSKEDFIKLVPKLADEGYNVWAYTQRGAPDSDAAESYELDDFAQDVCEFANVVRLEQPHLLGHSFGGVVATHAVIRSLNAYREPRFASLVQLCSGPHGWEGRMSAELQQLETGSVGDFFGTPDMADAADAVAAWGYRRGQDQNVAQLQAAARILASHEDVTADLAQARTRVAVMFGVDDAAWPQEWQRATAAQLGAPVVVIPDAGHCPNMENPRVTVAELVKFFESQSSATPAV